MSAKKKKSWRRWIDLIQISLKLNFSIKRTWTQSLIYADCIHSKRIRESTPTKKKKKEKERKRDVQGITFASGSEASDLELWGVWNTPLSLFLLGSLQFGEVESVRKMCPWCNGYRHRKWTRRLEFWTRLIAFHIAIIPLGKVWIQLFSLQLWVNSRTDWILQPWWGN